MRHSCSSQVQTDAHTLANPASCSCNRNVPKCQPMGLQQPQYLAHLVRLAIWPAEDATRSGVVHGGRRCCHIQEAAPAVGCKLRRSNWGPGEALVCCAVQACCCGCVAEAGVSSGAGPVLDGPGGQLGCRGAHSAAGMMTADTDRALVCWRVQQNSTAEYVCRSGCSRTASCCLLSFQAVGMEAMCGDGLHASTSHCVKCREQPVL